MICSGYPQGGIIGDVGCLLSAHHFLLDKQWGKELPFILDVQKNRKWQPLAFVAFKTAQINYVTLTLPVRHPQPVNPLWVE